jgi:chorismate mutase-like protein
MTVGSDIDTLAALRQQLNSLDEQIVRLLGRRFEICRAAARYKREHGIPMMQPGRVAEVKERCARIAGENAVDADFMRRLFSMIIDEACRMEDEIIDKPRSSAAVPGK